MQQYLLLYKGPATPPNASHAGWPQWFQKIGDALVDRGGPMAHGIAVSSDASATTEPTSLNGYSIVQAEDSDAVRKLVQDHPYLALGSDYSVEVFELPGK